MEDIQAPDRLHAKRKIQMEDDITASVLVPGGRLPYLDPEYSNGSLKFVSNCEYRFFQRPDDAVIKGFDHQAEKDLSGTNLFVTNYQPLTKNDVRAIKDDIQGFISYTEPVRKHIDEFLNGDDNYCIVSSEPRLVHGAPSKNPRYLELRADFVAPVKHTLQKSEHGCQNGFRLISRCSPPSTACYPGAETTRRKWRTAASCCR